MAAIVFAGRFYEFHKERIVSRLELQLKGVPGSRSVQISRADAIHRLQRKGMHTLARQDAKVLATDAFPEECLQNSRLRTRLQADATRARGRLLPSLSPGGSPSG